MTRAHLVAALLLPTLLLPALAACDDASFVTVENQFGGTYVIERVWWQSTLLDSPTLQGFRSNPERAVPGRQFAWAIVHGPTQELPVRTVEEQALEHRGEMLNIVFTETSVVGICGVNGTLSGDDAAEAARIFPAQVPEGYDPVTCTFPGF